MASRKGDQRLTSNQRSVLEVIIRANRDGSWVDIDQLMERVDYHVTKQALQFTLRFMIQKQLIVKGKDRVLRRGRRRVILIPTELGYAHARKRYVGEQLDGLKDIINDAYDVLD
jgi:hypothetical protein